MYIYIYIYMYIYIYIYVHVYICIHKHECKHKYNTMRLTAARLNILQHTASHCNTMHFDATQFNNTTGGPGSF